MAARGMKQKIGNGVELDWLYRFWAGKDPRTSTKVYRHLDRAGVGRNAKRAMSRRRRRDARAAAREEGLR